MQKFGLIGLAILLAIVWLVAWVVLKVTSGLIHLLLLIAAVLFVLHFLRGQHPD